MRKPAFLGLAIVLLMIVAALFVVARAIGNRKVHARGLFKLQLKNTDAPYNPYLYGNTFISVSNFLNNPKNQLLLAGMSKTDVKDFSFQGIFGVRGTSLCYVHYSGADTNTVQSVASNAANMVVLFLTTNQSAWEVTYIDSGCFTPAPPWRRLENIWSRFRNRYLN